MWDKVADYTNAANGLGTSISDVVRAQTLYVQQGLDMETSMGIAVQTLKMARIAGLEAADATDAMTAAMRGFNMEINEESA
ncbi:MAG: hypothetical protein MJ199_00305 [Bacilli bacterium]|nr:hypothetical protein [Bacilli bacterium]